ncbi:MAG: SseB family protein [Pseudomonadota bacterium]
MTDSLLDIAHGSGDRMRFFNAFTSAELFLLLDGAPEDDVIEPSVLETDEGRFVLVFDREERLAEFVGRIADRIALEGRDLVTMLAGQGIGLAFNPDVAPSSSIITPEDLDWLHATLAAAPQTGSAVPTGIRAPDAPRGGGSEGLRHACARRRSPSQF